MDSGFHIVSYGLKHDTNRILNFQEFKKAGSFHTSVFEESQFHSILGLISEKYTWQTKIKKMMTIVDPVTRMVMRKVSNTTTRKLSKKM